MTKLLTKLALQKRFVENAKPGKTVSNSVKKLCVFVVKKREKIYGAKKASESDEGSSVPV